MIACRLSGGASRSPRPRRASPRADTTTVTRGATRLPFALALIVCAALLVPAGAAALKYASRTMHMGTRGKDVAALQGHLTKLGFRTPRDGAFGKGTRSSVLELERKKHWKRDGKVPPKQARQIRALAQKKAKSKRNGGDSSGERFYFAGGDAPTLTLQGSSAGTARVDVVSEGGATVLTIDVPLGGTGGTGGGVSAEDNFTGTATWYGRDSNGEPAPDGAYRLVVSDKGGTGADVSGGTRGLFGHYNNIFPLRAPHDYGGPASRFGAPARVTSTRARTSAPPAARSWSRSRAATLSTPATRPAAPATMSSSTARDRAATTSTCTCSSPPWSARDRS